MRAKASTYVEAGGLNSSTSVIPASERVERVLGRPGTEATLGRAVAFRSDAYIHHNNAI